MRIQDFIEALPNIRMDSGNLMPDFFIDLQINLDNLKELVYQVARTFSKEGLSLNDAITEEISRDEIARQNTLWAQKIVNKIIKEQRMLTDFYVRTQTQQGQNYFSPYMLETIDRTRSDMQLIELFDRAKREKSMIDPNKFIGRLSEVKLSSNDVMYLLRNFNADSFSKDLSVKSLYKRADLPMLDIRDYDVDLNTKDLNLIFVARMAMSFDLKTQRITLDEFSSIFESFQNRGISETFLGKAALAKFFKSVIGPTPSKYDMHVLDVNTTEAYLELVNKRSPNHVVFLEQFFDLTVDRKKASNPESPAYQAKGSGTFLITNWIKSAYLQSARK